MEKINIKKVTISDIDQLQKTSRQTFFETFAAKNDEENMKKYLEERYATERLTYELNNTNSAFYFAELNGEVVGYIKLNFGQSQTELKEEGALEIERIYVLKEFHGKQAGQLLFEKAIEIARERNAGYIWLGVWEENQQAISFYRKNGFEAFDKHIFRLGDDEQTDIMMKLKL